MKVQSRKGELILSVLSLDVEVDWVGLLLLFCASIWRLIIYVWIQCRQLCWMSSLEDENLAVYVWIY